MVRRISVLILAASLDEGDPDPHEADPRRDGHEGRPKARDAQPEAEGKDPGGHDPPFHEAVGKQSAEGPGHQIR